MATIIPAIRQAAPRLTRQLFSCSHRAYLPTPNRSSKCLRLTQEAIPSSIRNLKTNPQCRSQAIAGPQPLATISTSFTSFLKLNKGKNSARGRDTAQATFFPRTSHKVVAYWLLGSAASVFGIVVFGGLTRLTESGYDYFAIWPTIYIDVSLA